jgi:hypothetical protein
MFIVSYRKRDCAMGQITAAAEYRDHCAAANRENEQNLICTIIF